MREHEGGSDDGGKEAFVALVKDALAHLLDAVYLQSHRLAPHLLPNSTLDPRANAQLLRETLLQAISDMKPPETLEATEVAARPYLVLVRKYVQGFSNEDIQEELAIGRRQFFREQRRALQALTDILWERRVSVPPAEYGRQTLSEELEELGLEQRAFDLQAAIAEAVAAVRSLACERQVALSFLEHKKAEVFADEDITRQLLVSLFSSLVRLFPGSYIEVSLRVPRRWLDTLVRIYAAVEAKQDLRAALSVPVRLASRLGGQLLFHPEPNQVQLRLPSARQEHVVIVDDNPKTLRLFSRYLEPYRYRVTGIQDSRHAFEEIARLKPDVVVLDIMMRSVDGWKILQTLRAAKETQDIPVIICSVLAEEELAHTVGAQAYLRKPVTQSALVTALAELSGR